MMVYNDKKIENYEVLAVSYGIYIESKDEKIKIGFNFKDSKVFDNLEVNKKVDILDDLQLEETLIENKIYYLYYLKENEVFLTKLSDNKYRFEVDIKNPKMIYTPDEDKQHFKSLKIDEEISFDYDYKPPKSTEMIDKEIVDHHFSLTDILDKL